MNREPTKVEMLFNLMRGIYGAQKMSLTWPTKKDLEMAHAQWEPQINQYSVDQLVKALNTVKRMMASNRRAGDTDCEWPNVGLILSCVEPEPTKRLSDPFHNETKEQREKRIAYGRERVAELRKILGFDNESDKSKAPR